MALYDARSRRRFPSYNVLHCESNGILDIILELSKLGHSQDEIADDLNGRGLRTVRGGPFNQSVISKIIKKAQAAGKLPERIED